MRCGNPLAKEGPAKMTSVAPAAPMPVDTASVVRSRYAAPLAVLGIVIAIFLLGLAASNALQARARIDDTLGVHQKRNPTLMADSKAPITMPPNIHDWLEHLRRIEERKNKLTAEQVASLKMFMTKYEALGPAAGLLSQSGDDEDMTNPTAPFTEKTTDLVAPWKQLIKDYQAVPPPPECQRLADEYYAGLNEVPAQMSDVQSIINSINPGNDSAANTGENDANKDALSKAYASQGKSEDIDAHFNSSDSLLGDVCNQYNTNKWFSISHDIGGGALGSPF